MPLRIVRAQIFPRFFRGEGKLLFLTDFAGSAANCLEFRSRCRYPVGVAYAAALTVSLGIIFPSDGFSKPASTLSNISADSLLQQRDPYAPPNPWPPVCGSLPVAEREKFDCGTKGQTELAASAQVKFPPPRDPYRTQGKRAPECRELPRAEREKFGFPIVCGRGPGSLLPFEPARPAQAGRPPETAGTARDSHESFLRYGNKDRLQEIRSKAENGD